MAGMDVHDGVSDGEASKRIPLEADFLYAYSTVPGKASVLSLLENIALLNLES
jgi:hypothetical protein